MLRKFASGFAMLRRRSARRTAPRLDDLKRFRNDQRGNVAVLFGLAVVPLMLAVGAAVDYSFASSIRTKLNAIADAAALAVVNRSALSLSKGAAEKMARDIFNAQSADMERVTIRNVSATVTDGSNGRTAVVSYTANAPTSILGLMNVKRIKLAGNSYAASAKPTYIDFYLLLDNTPSMGVGATTADINTMVANTSDQCAFACHDLSDSNNYYKLAKKLGVQMRIDVVRTATQKLMDTATATQIVPSQFRAAIYTFGTTCTSLGLSTVATLTSSLSSAKAQASSIDLMTIPYQGYNNDQCTNSDSALSALNTAITTPGNGSTSAQPQKLLFFVTDGVADASNAGSCSKPLTGGTRCQEPMDVSFCTTLKNRGVKIAVLYTTYLPLPTNAWYNTWIAPFQAQLGSNMQSCASPGLYFEVSPTQGISEAMTALFQKAVGQARLTQ
jgi:Flp pilus assembly protein TadG